MRQRLKTMALGLLTAVLAGVSVAGEADELSSRFWVKLSGLPATVQPSPTTCRSGSISLSNKSVGMLE